jgi:cathepsin B
MCIATNASIKLPLSSQDLCFCGSGSSQPGCAGGDPASAWEYIRTSGVVTGGQHNDTQANDDPFANSRLCSAFSLPHCHHHGPAGQDPYPAAGSAACPDVGLDNSPVCPAKCDPGSNRTFAKDKYSFTGEVSTFADAAAMQASIMRDGPLEVVMAVTDEFESYASGIFTDSGAVKLGFHAVRIVGWGVENSTKYWKVANSWNRFWGEGGTFRIVRGLNQLGIESQAVASSAGARWGPRSGPPPAPPQDCSAFNEGMCKATSGCHWCRYICQPQPCQ